MIFFFLFIWTIPIIHGFWSLVSASLKWSKNLRLSKHLSTESPFGFLPLFFFYNSLTLKWTAFFFFFGTSSLFCLSKAINLSFHIQNSLLALVFYWLVQQLLNYAMETSTTDINKLCALVCFTAAATVPFNWGNQVEVNWEHFYCSTNKTQEVRKREQWDEHVKFLIFHNKECTQIPS